MLNLIIKGTIDEAYAAAKARGVTLFNVRTYHDTPNEVYASTDSTYDRVARWYNQDTGCAPFPVGTLLHFSQSEPT